MKVWEMEEGKEYYIDENNSFRMRLKDGAWEYYHNRLGEWRYSTERINVIKDYDFEEVVDTNSHWKPEKDDTVCKMEFVNGINEFHLEDKEKARCLALEIRIKSVLLNWRRLYDYVELDWGEKEYVSITYDLNFNKCAKKHNDNYLDSGFGYFSNTEKAQQFYEYMKEDIDKYFQIRKELKF